MADDQPKPPPSPPPSAPPEPAWARRLRYIGPLGPLVTMVVLAVSAFAAWNVYFEARQQNAAQREGAVRQQMLLRDSIDQNTIASIYTLGMETTKFLVQYPEIRVYFEASEDYRVEPRKEDPDQRRDWLYQRFDKEPDLTKQRVWTYCQMLADFYEYTFVLRHLLPERDWDGRWFYFCDAYDESPFLKAYFKSRPTWYTVDEVLALPAAQRAAWYEEDKKRIAQLKAERK